MEKDSTKIFTISLADTAVLYTQRKLLTIIKIAIGVRF